MAPTLGSPALLLQLTTNLVHNAIVHNLPGHGTVSVSTSVQPKNVLLTVENTGDVLHRTVGSRRWSSRSSAAPSASIPTTLVSASAWRSSRALRRRTMGS